MASEIQWRNVARAYYERYVKTHASFGVEIEKKFDELDEQEVTAIIDALKYAVHLVVTACMA